MSVNDFPKAERGKPATVKDVAAMAGVSTATVSRVLNGQETVEVDMRRRVLSAADALSYQPNRQARSLRRRLSQLIGLVVPDIRNPFFAEVSHEVEEVAFRRGYTVLTCNTNDDPGREVSYFDVLGREHVAGIVLCTVDERRGHLTVNPALERGIAVVGIDRRIEKAAVDLVLSDNFGGARAAVSHLVERGHRRVGLITGPDGIAPARERRLGYEQALRDHGLAPLPELVHLTDFRDTGAERATFELLDLPEPPTAVFVGNGVAAVGALRALGARDLHLGRDLALATFDEPEWARVLGPIVTVAQNVRAIGATAIELLLERVEGKRSAAEERRIPTALHVREDPSSPSGPASLKRNGPPSSRAPAEERR